MLDIVQTVQEEVDFVVSNFDFALEPGQALNKYMHHRKILTYLMVIDAIYELGLIYYMFCNTDFLLA